MFASSVLTTAFFPPSVRANHCRFQKALALTECIFMSSMALEALSQDTFL